MTSLLRENETEEENGFWMDVYYYMEKHNCYKEVAMKAVDELIKSKECSNCEETADELHQCYRCKQNACLECLVATTSMNNIDFNLCFDCDCII